MSYIDDSNNLIDQTTLAELDDTNENVPIILEGVASFDIKIWDDYPGGKEIDVSLSPLAEKPSCITFSVTLTDPNPAKANLPTAVKNRSNRTITKTIYIDR